MAAVVGVVLPIPVEAVAVGAAVIVAVACPVAVVGDGAAVGEATAALVGEAAAAVVGDGATVVAVAPAVGLDSWVGCGEVDTVHAESVSNATSNIPINDLIA